MTDTPTFSEPLETAEDCVLAVHGGAGVLSAKKKQKTSATRRLEAPCGQATSPAKPRRD